jgi:hypothetical protein
MLDLTSLLSSISLHRFAGHNSKNLRRDIQLEFVEVLQFMIQILERKLTCRYGNIFFECRTLSVLKESRNVFYVWW